MKKFTPFFIFILIMFCLVNLSAQKEANIWYFGHNAGLDFNGSTPIALTDGAINTDEGCASIADSNGDLLFYTDGKVVWNKSHQQMPNGFGMFGHKSSTQSGVIVPKPGSNSIYYIFTVDFTANSGGIAYSEVDMNLNGGLGDITVKNVQLLTPACEKITAVLHENEQDIWVIGHAWQSNVYHAWLVSPNGVNSNSVTSAVGVNINGSTFNTIGYLKASAEGDRIAAAHWHNLNRVEVFDFDNSTGTLSNPITLTGFTGSGCYGVEFAPTEPILYVSERTFGGFLYQYDLSSGNEPTIQASEITLATYDGRWGAIQLGPDGKMYVAKQDNEYLAVINKPDNLGLDCDYIDDAVFLDGQLSWIGLPSFIQSYFVNADFSYEGVCPTFPTVFTLDVPDTVIDSLSWDFGDPASGANNTSTVNDPTHTYSIPGTYEVTLIVFGQGDSDTSIQEITLEFPSVDLGPDLTSCANIPNLLDATTPDATYLWSDGSTGATLEAIDSGAYWVEIQIEGCPASDTVIVNHLALPEVELEPDPEICEDETYTFDGTTTDVVSYLWNNNSTSPTLLASGQGNYSVTVTDVNGCTNTDESFLTIHTYPVINLGASPEVCEGDIFTINSAVGGNTTYLWSDGSSNPTLDVTQAGTYTVLVTTDGCTTEDELEVFYTTLPTVDLGLDTLMCAGEEIYLDAFYDEFTTYTWQNNSNLSDFTISQPGIYTVDLTNICGTVTDEIIVEENTPPTPLFIGNDTTICIDESFVIDAANTNTTHYLWNNGSEESSILIDGEGYYAITWANNCGFVTEYIEVETRKCECIVTLPNVFSPNGDGNNDKFNTVSPCDYYTYNLKIFSRWGELVFETDDPAMASGWDGRLKGKNLQEGVYVYVVEYSHEFDTGQISGDVTIIR